MARVIAIDGHNLALPKGTGVATYARNLSNTVESLGWSTKTLYGAPISREMDPLLREVSFFDYLGGAEKKRIKALRALALAREMGVSPFGKKILDIPISGKVEFRKFKSRLPNKSEICNVYDLFGVARRYFQVYKKFLTVEFDSPPDVMHWTYPLPIRAIGVPNVYTLHDLVPLKLPYTTLDNKKYYHELISGCIKNAAAICTVSERSRSDILEMFDVSESKVVNTYQAVADADIDKEKTQDQADAEVRGIFGLPPKKYFLFFGAIEPKKNVSRLVEAFLSAQLNMDLVIVGSYAWKSQDERASLESVAKRKLESGGGVHHFDFVPRSFLVSLIKSSRAVVFPSLYEGFGLPVLEAMQLGTPVLSSNGGSLSEIVGSAAEVVNPYDTQEIAAGLRRLALDDARCEQLSVAGRERALVYSVENYQIRLKSFYDGILR